MFIILSYIGSALVIIIAFTISAIYVRKHPKVLVKGTHSKAQKRSFMNNPLLIITVLTPILFAIAWIISWMYSPK